MRIALVPGAVTPVYADEHHCIALAGGWLGTYSRQPPDPSLMAKWNAAAAQLTEQRSGRFSVLTILDASLPPPDDASRELLRATMQRHARAIERIVYVVEGRGFHAAAIRSVISLLGLVARTPYSQKVFASVEEASAWIARTPDETGAASAAELRALAAALRDRVDRWARVG